MKQDATNSTTSQTTHEKERREREREKEVARTRITDGIDATNLKTTNRRQKTKNGRRRTTNGHRATEDPKTANEKLLPSHCPSHPREREEGERERKRSKIRAIFSDDPRRHTNEAPIFLSKT